MAICYKAAWTKYEDITYTGDTFNLTRPCVELLSPESLRAAAKVLEEKAKELDKPKLNDRQRAAFDYAEKYCLDVVDFDGDSYGSVYRIGGCPEFICKSKMAESFYHQFHSFSGGHLIAIRNYVDEDGDMETDVVWPK